MDKKPTTELVSENERDFIRQVFSDKKSQLPSARQASEFSASLKSASRLQLTAELGEYTLIFSPQMDLNEESHTQQLKLGCPQVLENSGTKRPKRVQPAQERIQVQDETGCLRGISVENISTSGIALLVANQPSELRVEQTIESLRIKLTKLEAFSARARIIRVDPLPDSDKAFVALEFIALSPLAEELLMLYIFDHSPVLKKSLENMPLLALGDL